MSDKPRPISTEEAENVQRLVTELVKAHEQIDHYGRMVTKLQERLAQYIGGECTCMSEERKSDIHFPGCPKLAQKKLTQANQDNAELLSFVHEAREIFDKYADADCDQDGFIPNAEMRGLTEADRLIAKHGEQSD